MMRSELVLASAEALPSEDSRSLTMGRTSFAVPYCMGITAISARQVVDKAKHKAKAKRISAQHFLFFGFLVDKTMTRLAFTGFYSLSPS
jgi:hypothetical protein